MEFFFFCKFFGSFSFKLLLLKVKNCYKNTKVRATTMRKTRKTWMPIRVTNNTIPKIMTIRTFSSGTYLRQVRGNTISASFHVRAVKIIISNFVNLLCILIQLSNLPIVDVFKMILVLYIWKWFLNLFF